METINSISLEEAQAVASAAVQKAQELEQPMNVAVTEVGGNLKAFARMEQAWTASISIAQDKAYTSAALGFSTQDIGEMAQPGQPLFGINTTNDGRIVVFGGGIPLVRDGKVVGAIGVSGGTPDQDHEVAQAGVAAFG